MLVPLWVPPLEVRELRALLAQRRLQVRLATQAKNRWQAVLQRHHLAPPAGALFAPAQNDWWHALPVSPIEKVRLHSDLATLTFARQQQAACEKMLVQLAAQDERMPLLIQLPGVSLIVGLTVLAAIGDIARFAAAAKLVGYAGLGSRVHDSGLTRTTGPITKAGRRELRVALVEAAQIAANTHPHWQAERARLEPRLGRNKAIVALARKLLVVMWHVLTDAEADRHAEPERVARKLMQFTYRLGKKNRRTGQRATDYVREQLDRLSVGQEVTDLRLGQTKIVHLPVSTRPRTQSEA